MWTISASNVLKDLNLRKKVLRLCEKGKTIDKAQEASYRVAKLIAKQMKACTVGETLILPLCKETAGIKFGSKAEKGN